WYVELTSFHITDERDTGILAQPPCRGEISRGRQIGIHARHRVAIEATVLFVAVVKSDKRDTDGGAVENPGLITPRHEVVAILLDALQDPAVETPADRVRRQ